MWPPLVKGQGHSDHFCSVFAPELVFPDNIFEVPTQNFTKITGMMHYGPRKTPMDFDFHTSKVKATVAIFLPFSHPKLGFRMISSKSLHRISPNLQDWCIMGQRRHLLILTFIGQRSRSHVIIFRPVSSPKLGRVPQPLLDPLLTSAESAELSIYVYAPIYYILLWCYICNLSIFFR